MKNLKRSLIMKNWENWNPSQPQAPNLHLHLLRVIFGIYGASMRPHPLSERSNQSDPPTSPPNVYIVFSRNHTDGHFNLRNFGQQPNSNTFIQMFVVHSPSQLVIRSIMSHLLTTSLDSNGLYLSKTKSLAP